MQELTDLTEWWGKMLFRMKKPAEFAAQVEEVDRLFSFDVKSSNQHLLFHPFTSNVFVPLGGTLL